VGRFNQKNKAADHLRTDAYWRRRQVAGAPGHRRDPTARPLGMCP
jgi:hypothetical protein